MTIECRSVNAQVGWQVLRGRGAHRAFTSPRERPRIERIEPRGIERLCVRRRRAITRHAPLSGREAHDSEIRGKRRVSAHHGQLGLRTGRRRQHRQSEFAGTVGVDRRRRRVDLVLERIRRVVGAGDDEQKPSVRQSEERVVQQLERRSIVDVHEGAIGKEHLRATADRPQEIARHKGHSMNVVVDLALTFKRDDAFGV